MLQRASRVYRQNSRFKHICIHKKKGKIKNNNNSATLDIFHSGKTCDRRGVECLYVFQQFYSRKTK